ncbi:MAG: hypothetical protein ACP5HG_12980 [Anaerolineae bacterium]
MAPNHKFGLPIAVPVMPASGVFGYGDAYQDLVELSCLGAVVTNPVSLRPRRAARGQRIAALQDSFVVHTGWPNLGLRAVIREFGETWARLPIPVIVHLLATGPGEVAQSAAILSGVQNVTGVEIGFRADVTPAQALALLDAARTEGDLPVIAKVPFGRVRDLGPRLVEQGVDALTLTDPPRAVLPFARRGEEPGVARYMRGRLYGRALFPLLLSTFFEWARKLGVPLIACGGIGSPEDALACLTLGAAAVQVDALLWREPSLLMTIAQKLTEPKPAPESIRRMASPDGAQTEVTE